MHNGQKTRIAVSRVFHLSDARRPEPDYAKPRIHNLTRKRHARYAYATDAKPTKNNALGLHSITMPGSPSAAR